MNYFKEFRYLFVEGSFSVLLQNYFLYTLEMKTISTLCVLALASSLVFVNAEEKEKKDEKKKDNVGTVIGIDLGTTYSW